MWGGGGRSVFSGLNALCGKDVLNKRSAGLARMPALPMLSHGRVTAPRSDGARILGWCQGQLPGPTTEGRGRLCCLCSNVHTARVRLDRDGLGAHATHRLAQGGCADMPYWSHIHKCRCQVHAQPRFKLHARQAARRAQRIARPHSGGAGATDPTIDILGFIDVGPANQLFPTWACRWSTMMTEGRGSLVIYDR